MAKLTKIQRDHFKAMRPDELTKVIQDASRQIDHISFATTEAANRKREELNALIDFCEDLVRKFKIKLNFNS